MACQACRTYSTVTRAQRAVLLEVPWLPWQLLAAAAGTPLYYNNSYGKLKKVNIVALLTVLRCYS